MQSYLWIAYGERSYIVSKIKKVLLGTSLTVINAVCIIMFFLTVGKEAEGFIFETWMAITASISSTFFFGYTYVELIR